MIDLLARLAAVVALAGCAVATAPAPIRVEVRDARTRAPIAGARVRAESIHLFVPADDVPLIGSQAIVDPSPPPSDDGTTGADGSVVLQLSGRHPYRLLVVAPGHDPLELVLERRPEAGDASSWVDPASGDGVDPRRPPGLAVRVAAP